MSNLREKIANQKVIVFGCGKEIGNPCVISEKMSERSVDHLEQITDDFSVKFNIWVSKNFVLDSDEIGFAHIWKDEWYNHQELLQIFKEKYYE